MRDVAGYKAARVEGRLSERACRRVIGAATADRASESLLLDR
jgi:hypothetical protein